MKLDPETILKRANELYAQAKADKRDGDPTKIPCVQIQSDQVKSILTAICEFINAQPEPRATVIYSEQGGALP